MSFLAAAYLEKQDGGQMCLKQLFTEAASSQQPRPNPPDNARATTLICPNWCPFVRGDILSQIWSLHCRRRSHIKKHGLLFCLGYLCHTVCCLLKLILQISRLLFLSLKVKVQVKRRDQKSSLICLFGHTMCHTVCHTHTNSPLWQSFVAGRLL